MHSRAASSGCFSIPPSSPIIRRGWQPAAGGGVSPPKMIELYAELGTVARWREVWLEIDLG